MRLFMGLCISEDIKEAVKCEVSRIMPQISKAKYANPVDYHITVKFIGDVSDEVRNELTKALLEHPLHIHPFELELSTLGCFHKSKGDILWVGLRPNAALMSLHQIIEKIVEPLGFMPDAIDYVPHLTLGRGVRYSNRFEVLLDKWSLKDCRFIVDRVVLFHSAQLEGQLRYIPIVEKNFEGADFKKTEK